MISPSLPGSRAHLPAGPVRGKFAGATEDKAMNEETGELPPSLLDLITTVGYFQAAYARADELVRALEAEHAALYEAKAAAKAELATYEAQLRAATVNAHNAGEELPQPLSVRYIKKPLFEPVLMEAWARLHAPELLVLDEVKVRKVAGKLHGAPLEIAEVPVAVIGNLSQWTAGAREIEGVVAG